MNDLTLWTVYWNPSDYPGKYVLRGWDVGFDQSGPRQECVVSDSLEEVRAALPPGLARLAPSEVDDRTIVEVWI